MQLGLQKLLVCLIGHDMSFNSLISMGKKLVFEPHSEIKGDIVGVSFNCKSKEFDLEVNIQ
jgi:hypothetical protein